MTAFVDTSAFFALLAEDDDNHAAASAILPALRGEPLVTHAYVVVETLALVGRRLPWPASERLMDLFIPVVDVRPVDDSLHRAASLAYREAATPTVSFVDRTSFAFMRVHAIRRAFAFDTDFGKNGFEPLSPPT